VKTAKARMIFDCLRRAVQPSGAGLTDGQLLRQYFAHRDEAAFAALVRRHGPMVLAVCRRLLGRAEDAEDAFQAAFVVLARKGHRVAGQPTIGGWLHGVAYHVALNVRNRVARRQRKERQVEIMPHPLVMPAEDQSELLAVLDRELARLPEKYRLPVVLCELEGRSRKEAARQLGLPEGTLSSRLAAARKTLARRMASHGLAVAGASLTALFASEAGAAVVPGPLIASTVRAAGGVASAGVVALAEGVMKAMLLTKIKAAGLVLLLAASFGAVGLTYRTATAQTAPGAQTAAKAATAEKYDLEALRLEVEALRASLQATRERVKALEAREQARKEVETVNEQARALKEVRIREKERRTEDAGGVPFTQLKTESRPEQSTPSLNPGGPVLPAPKLGSDPAATPPTTEAPRAAPTPPARIATPPRITEKPPPAGERADAEAKVKAAAHQLLLDPTNKQAQDLLKNAVKQMNRLSEPKPTNVPR
jgi:RNA polymerase sigma factor (sigma-70 family)